VDSLFKAPFFGATHLKINNLKLYNSGQLYGLKVRDIILLTNLSFNGLNRGNLPVRACKMVRGYSK